MYPSDLLRNDLHRRAFHHGGLEALAPERSRLEAHARAAEAKRRRRRRAAVPEQSPTTLVADPFAPTADLVALPRVRAAHRHGRGRPRLGGRLAPWRRLWPAARPGEIC